MKISEHIDTMLNESFDIALPPVEHLREMNHIIIGVTTRSPLAFVLVPFMLVSITGSLGGIYGTQFINGEFNLIISLFGIPFVIGAIIFWSLAIMSIWGKVEVKLDRSGGEIFTRVGNMGTTKRFTWDEIATVSEIQYTMGGRNTVNNEIILESTKKIKFTKGVNTSRKYYLFQAFKTIFNKANQRKVLSNCFQYLFN